MKKKKKGKKQGKKKLFADCNNGGGGEGRVGGVGGCRRFRENDVYASDGEINSK